MRLSNICRVRLEPGLQLYDCQNAMVLVSSRHTPACPPLHGVHVLLTHLLLPHFAACNRMQSCTNLLPASMDAFLEAPGPDDRANALCRR